MTATLRIRRGGGYADRIRRYKLLVDGEEKGDIGANETVELTVPHGGCVLAGKIDWCGSPDLELDLKEGEVAELEISNRYGALRGIYAITFAQSRYLKLERAG